jgi:hypothetical protein
MPIKSAAEWMDGPPPTSPDLWVRLIEEIQQDARADALEAAAKKAMARAKPIGPLIAKGEDEGPMGMLLPSWIARDIRALIPKPEVEP